MKILLEICAGSIASAIAAEEGGADRVELCTALNDGGLTPSLGMIKEAKRLLSIPIHVLIRPREGDFLYTNNELAVICEDIYAAKNQGVEGIVCGVLDKNGDIDVPAMELILKASKGMSCTFHRAFDVCRHPLKAIRILMELGINTLLTSGQAPTAPEGTQLIKELVSIANKRQLSVMPGCGINADNIMKVALTTGANALHLSAKKRVTNYDQTNANEVRACRKALDSIEKQINH